VVCVPELPHGALAEEKLARCRALGAQETIDYRQGGFAGGEVQSVRASHVLMRNYSVVGLYMGAYSANAHGRELVGQVHAEIVRLYMDGRIQVVIDRVVGLEDVPVALADLGGRRTTGKVVVRP